MDLQVCVGAQGRGVSGCASVAELASPRQIHDSDRNPEMDQQLSGAQRRGVSGLYLG